MNGYPSTHTHLAKQLRKQSTDAESLLWHRLRNKQTGYKFRRQQPIQRYIVDFFYSERKLIIELDGGQHNELSNQVYDASRSLALQKAGYYILRFWNHDVIENLEGALHSISEHLTLPLPLPSREGNLEHSPLEGESKSAQRDSVGG